MNTLSRACALIALIGLEAVALARPVHTDLSQIHQCLPLADDSTVLAASDGGLIVAGADGASRAVWTALDGLPGTRVRALVRDGDTLWIGTEGGVAKARLRGGDLTVVATYKSKPVHALALRDGALYVGTWGDGVKRLRGSSLTPIRFAGKGDPARQRIADLTFHDGQLIAATAGRGLFRLDRHRMRPMASRLARKIAWSVESHDGVLWAGTVNGLYAVHATRVERVAQGDVRDVRAINGRVVAAVFGSGVRTLAGDSFRKFSNTPDAARFAYAYAADSGMACIGTHRGLWVQRQARAWKRADLQGLPSSDISAMAVTGSRLWVGTFSNGLAVYERGAWRQLNSPRLDPHINGLAVSKGKLWVATSAGLTVVDGDRITRLTKHDGLPSRHVLSVTALRDGGVLAGTTRGAAIIRGSSISVLHHKQGLYVGNVWSVAEDHNGALWLGTTKGLYRVRPGQKPKRFTVASGHLRDDWVMAIAPSRGSIWVGMYKGGVTKLTVTEQDSYEATHIGDGWVNPGGLTWHGDKLYASTMDGLFISDGHTWHNRRNAAPGRDTTAVIAQPLGASRARLWVSSRRGLAALTPR